MRYKTIFRLGIKAIGVLLFFEGLTALVFALANLVTYLLETGQAWPTTMSRTFYVGPFAQAFKAALGVYLFFRGEWIVNLAIPGNRPYCPECAYDLTGAVEPRCPECGTAFGWEDVKPKAVADASSAASTNERASIADKTAP